MCGKGVLTMLESYKEISEVRKSYLKSLRLKQPAWCFEEKVEQLKKVMESGGAEKPGVKCPFRHFWRSW